ncbi:hypothetical protein PWT90_01634 [Aphanocladium album]|nr:hypothetical protein PWT90_01634 [Aphanocladium album]
MPSHFQDPSERLSDDDLSKGFSFDVRQVNKQGQFSGPATRSIIIPGTRPADQPCTSVSSESPAQRITLPFSGLDFSSGFQRGTANSGTHATLAGAHVMRSANGNANTSFHFASTSDYHRPGSGGAVPATDQQFNQQDQSIPSENNSRSPPTRSCNRRIHATSPAEPRDIPSPGIDKAAPNTGDSVFRNTESFRVADIDTGLNRSQTPQHCGDLEGYGEYEASSTTRTPNNVRLSRRGQSRSRGYDIASSVSRRTHSRASNISRKRRMVGVDYQAFEPDRKRLAMSEAVKHWNECMQITTEESDRAKSAINHLKRKLQRQASELQAAQQALQTGNTDLRVLQKQYKDLQAKDYKATEGKGELEVKYKELSTEYERLRAQVKELPSKYSSCEGKLDGAISEQRELFNKSKNFYNSLAKRLEEDEARGKANVEAVEQALETSKQKRDELKKFVEHMQHDFQFQKSEYEHKIQTLEERNEAQCDQIDAIEEDKEKLYHEMIASRSTKACIEGVNARLSGFVAQLRALDASKDTSAIELRSVKLRLDDLPTSNDLLELKAQASASDIKINDLEKLIRESLLPAIESISSRQTDSQTSVDSLAAIVETGLVKVQDRIQTHAIELDKTLKSDNNSRAEVANLLNLISAANGDLSSRVEVANSRLENLSENISSRGTTGIKITKICEAIQQLSDRSDSILAAQGKQNEVIGNRHELLAGQIDSKALNQETVTRELINGIKHQLDTTLSTMQERLAAKAVKSDGKFISVDKKSLKQIEALRSNLQQIESQLSKVEKVPSSLQKIYDLSLLIEETSKYMDKEEHWVHKIIGERQLDSDTCTTTDISTTHESTSQHSVFSRSGVGSSSQGSSAEDISDSQSRKVVVHSPKLQCDSPLPVTRAQEQRRRRENNKPRSILKQTQTASTMDMTTTQPSLACSSNPTSEEVVAEIRSALVQSLGARSQSSLQQGTGLTSISDYLKFAKGTNRNSTAVLGDLADAEATFGNIISPPNIAAAV